MRAISLLGLVLFAAMSGCGQGDPVPPGPPAPPEASASEARQLTRLFVQDLKTSSLKWADVRIDNAGQLSLDPLAAVEDFPKLDPARQKLVQMKEASGLVCVGVRDDDEGKFASGWVLLRSGVKYLDHGDHGHWSFRKKPLAAARKLDAAQGNPAHLYEYGGKFFLANDRRNGYTRIDPAEFGLGHTGTTRFLSGGGNHITLAVADDRVGYSCWIDGGGPNKGRVDVTPVTDKPTTEPAYSFRLPAGGIHGAITNAGKVFFAPSDGIDWVDADIGLTLKPEQVTVHHIDLGQDGGKSHRTGAFVNHGRYVLFVTGKGTAPALMLLDAKAADPKPVFIPLGAHPGTTPVTPEIAVTADGQAYAFVFHDRIADTDGKDALEVIALDPNGDGDCSGARVVKAMPVGQSAVEGHYGHHDLAFDADRRFAFFTNPGDGTIAALSLKTLDVVATFPVGGTPTTLVARGGRETDD